MEARAVSKYVRISPQKVRMMVGAVKGRAGRGWFKYTQIYAAEGGVYR